MIGIRPQSQSPHDGSDAFPMFGECLPVQRHHLVDAMSQPIPALAVSGGKVDLVERPCRLVQIAAALAHLTEDLRQQFRRLSRGTPRPRTWPAPKRDVHVI